MKDVALDPGPDRMLICIDGSNVRGCGACSDPNDPDEGALLVGEAG